MESRDRAHPSTRWWYEGVAVLVGIFSVERTLTGTKHRHRAAGHRALGESSRRLSDLRDVVHYLRSTFVPAHAQCACMSESNTVDVVRLVNELARVPFGKHL
jgi:hypothetical protein